MGLFRLVFRLLRLLAVALVVLFRLLHWFARVAWWAGRWSWKFLRYALKPRSTTFGSAHWASLWQLLAGKALGSSAGLIVGKAFGRLLRFQGEGALLVYAPMGSGKGLGIVVPNLLDHPGSIIVTDPKGENAAVTGRHRETLGPVYRLDATNPCSSHCFNPLSLIRRGSAFEPEDIAMLSDMLVMPETAEAHWDTSAKNTIAMFIGYVLHAMPKSHHTLSMVRELLVEGSETTKRRLQKMAKMPNTTVAEQARALLAGYDTDETRSVLGNAAKALVIWSKDRIAGRLSMASDFDMMDLHRRIITVYIMVPEELLAVYAPFLRVMLGCAVIALLRAKMLPRPEHLPLVLVDECAALGRLDALEKAVGYLRAYARLILILQDLGQLQQIYGENGARTFIAASGAQVAFRVSDTKTARDLADSIGMKTVHPRSAGFSQANTDLIRAQEQAGRSEAGRYLIDPAEVRRLPDHKAIVQLSTVRAPILATKIKYFTERRWKGLWDVWRA
ncbi:type IV secretory system conjugative DNA transfer family protein [Methylosinus sporium]|uniref:Type IV secretory system conjugative DNA transfer family protein n=1 Tax=Methylosinus sporium TaxID=428 RepID=A0A549T6X5_METSR|nr:type IV secretory system conjugative DNA transfer family protein [Methylosinus sporium]TRL37600.1 type IV secretory system conjugative DNA transfer family protein [Methylosinus sporium]